MIKDVEQTLLLARKTLEIFQACDEMYPIPTLDGKHQALLASALLGLAGVSALPIHTWLRGAGPDIDISFAINMLSIEAFSGNVRMNLYGDHGDEAVAGLVRRWQNNGTSTFIRPPVIGRWYAIDPKRWAIDLPENHFTQLAKKILAAHQARELDAGCPPCDESRAGLRF